MVQVEPSDIPPSTPHGRPRGTSCETPSRTPPDIESCEASEENSGYAVKVVLNIGLGRLRRFCKYT